MLDQAKLDLRDTKLHAEIAGFIGHRLANPGNRVSAGQGLMALRPLEDIWIDANFKETQINDLQIGQSVDIRRMRIPAASTGDGSQGSAPAQAQPRLSYLLRMLPAIS